MKEKLSILLGYIEQQKDNISAICLKLNDIKPLNEDKMIHAAYLLHNLYSAYEDMFKEISMAFENNIDRNEGFHKNLLFRMKIKIPGIRPPVITEDSYNILLELLGFRHVFRHAYNYSLQAEKMERLRKLILENYENIESDIETFRKSLENEINRE